MTIDTDLRDRLRDLADEAPRGQLSGADLWRSGVRRQRRRRVVASGAVVAALAAVVGLGSVLGLPQAERPGPAEVPFEELAIPRAVHAPDPWSEGTAELGPPGRLAVVSAVERREANGLRDSHVWSQLFGISAADGTARFIDVRTHPRSFAAPTPGMVALSPDGTKLAMAHYRGSPNGPQPVVGWVVYDTVTGKTTSLRVPGMPVLQGLDTFEIQFTADSRFLMTSFSLTGSTRSKQSSLVVWDVETGDRHVAEGPGHYWLPTPGAGPGIVWSRFQQVMSLDPDSGATRTRTVAQDVVEAHYSPDGNSLAFVGHGPSGPDEATRWHLFVGPAQGPTEEYRRIDVGFVPGDLLGWRDDRRLVVSDYGPRGAREVDVVTGEVEKLGLHQVGQQSLTALYATDLLANELVEGSAHPDAHDPRVWLRGWFWATVAGLGAVVAVLVLWRRRGRA